LNNKKTDALVFSYCLYEDETRLSVMAEKSAEIGIAAVCNREASGLIFSTAYKCWEKEARLKKEMATKKGIDMENIHFLEGVTRTSDEIAALKDVLKKLGTHKLIVVCEKYHVGRATRFLGKNFPRIEFDFRVFQTKYERTFEPSGIKSFKGSILTWVKSHRGSLVTWWLWCFLCNLFNK